MYAPSELLEQVEKQAQVEFGDQITRFEWFDEEEYTTIMVEITRTALQIRVGERIRQLVNAIVGEQYIVAIGVTPIESVDATDGLFNLRCTGGTTFSIDYYPITRPRSNPFSTPIYYLRMFEAVRTIHLDSAAQLWERLIRPLDEKYAKHEGVNSFSKELLAGKLRDFLRQHLDFIKHIAEAVGKPLQILEPVRPPAPLPSNKTGRSPKKARRTKVAPEMALPALAAA